MQALVASLETLLDDVADFRGAARAIKGLCGADDDVNALREAFRLHMSDGERVPDAELYWGLDSIEPPVVVLWLHALEVARHPVLVARLGDLCWLRRAASRRDLPARSAIQAFIELSQRWDGLPATTCLRRGVALARGLGEVEALRQAYGIAAGGFDRWIDERDKPGISMRYLRLLARARGDEHSIDLTPCFAKAKAVLGHNPDILEEITELERGLLGDDPARHLALRREAAEGYFRAAQNVSGISSLHWLQKAKAIANDMPDLRDELLMFERAFDPASIEWQAIEVPLDEIVPHYEALGRPLYEAPDWQTAFVRWVELGSPSGDSDHNIELAQRIRASSVLELFATQMVVNASTGQARAVETEDQRLQRGVSEIELRDIQINLELIAVQFLRTVPSRHQASREEMQAWLCESGAPVDAVRAFVRALFDYWAESDYLPSALAMAAAVEALVRHHADQRGIVVTTNALGGARGGVKPMGELISALEGHIDESWRRFLRTALVADEGANLRNQLFHGLLLRPNEGVVVTLALAALYLCRLPAPSTQPEPASAFGPT